MNDPPVLDKAAFFAAAKAGLAADWQHFAATHPDQEIYGYGFYCHETNYLMSTTFTEAGLVSIAQRNAERTSRPVEQYRRQLRWSPSESPFFAGTGPNFDRIPLLEEAESIVSAAADALNDYYDQRDAYPPDGAHRALTESMYDTLIDVLNELDAEGLFGSTRTLVLNVWEGDQSFEDRERFARRCNPPDIADRFCAEERDSYWQ